MTLGALWRTVLSTLGRGLHFDLDLGYYAAPQNGHLTTTVRLQKLTKLWHISMLNGDIQIRMRPSLPSKKGVHTPTAVNVYSYVVIREQSQHLYHICHSHL